MSNPYTAQQGTYREQVEDDKPLTLIHSQSPSLSSSSSSSSSTRTRPLQQPSSSSSSSLFHPSSYSSKCPMTASSDRRGDLTRAQPQLYPAAATATAATATAAAATATAAATAAATTAAANMRAPTTRDTNPESSSISHTIRDDQNPLHHPPILPIVPPSSSPTAVAAHGRTDSPLQIRYHPHSRQSSISAHSRQGSVTGLQIRTDLLSSSSTSSAQAVAGCDPQAHQQHSHFPSANPDSASTIATSGLTPSSCLRKTISAASLNSALSPNGGLASPALAAMLDITPLPSPIMSGELSPTPWRRLRTKEQKPGADRPTSSGAENGDSRSHQTATAKFHVPMSPASPPKRKKGYGSLAEATLGAQRAIPALLNAAALEDNNNNEHQYHNRSAPRGHGRNRSISDFVPEALNNVRPRHVTMAANALNHSQEQPMHREQYLAAQRGLVTPTLPHFVDSAHTLPSPPRSNKSVTSSDVDEEESRFIVDEEPNIEYFHVRDTHNPTKKRKWRAVRPLGQGTFSKVILATSQRMPPGTPYDEPNLDPSRLVAVKIVEHGPAGGADEERIEVSLKREVDILKSVSHPSIVQLKALEYTDDRALLVLTYCPGGDLFELASQKRELLSRPLVQRIFAEVLGAVTYLHDEGVVHRDLKLENVLVYPRSDFLASLQNPQSHPHPLISVTDLGLSRRIPPPPASPLLTTRCGSEDYAAPEILLGQPYDGRSTDAWALGVLLYALMEGRLPFDCPPGKPERSRVSHRVARCDWIWTRFGDDDGEWDESKECNNEWRGAGLVVEGLLKKVRMGRKSLKEVQEMEWAQQGLQLPNGIKELTRIDDGTGEL